MADYLADVGRRLREARVRNRPDLSGHEAAARELTRLGVHVSSKQYGRWERGESEPRGNKREKLVEMLGVTVEDIWGLPQLAPEDELREQLTRIEETQQTILAEMRTIRLALAAPSRRQSQRQSPAQKKATGS